MKLSFFICVLFIFLSCSAKKEKDKLRFKVFVSDTSGGKFDEIAFSNWRTDMLNLRHITEGVDSFELRLWTWGIWTRRDLLLLKYFDNKWVSCNYTYYQNMRQVVDSLNVLCREMHPDSANKLQSYFTQDSIINLPSQSAIPNYRDRSADGITYFLEISTKHFYKVLAYHNPHLYADSFNMAFSNHLKYLKGYFDIIYLY